MLEDLIDDILADFSDNEDGITIEAICQRSSKLNVVKKFIQCFHEDREKVVLVAVSTKVGLFLLKIYFGFNTLCGCLF